METIQEPIPSIEWIITDRCNYQCDYCFQRVYAKARHCSDETIEATFRLLPTLEGSWLIKLIGGEPLLHPRLFEMSERIMAHGHCLSTSSNFSPPIRRLVEWSDLCGDQLIALTASLHLGQVRSQDEFLAKCVEFNRSKSAGTHFVVASVLTEDNFEQLKQIEQYLEREGVNFCYQVMRSAGKFVEYSTEIEDYISSRIPPETQALRKHQLFGTLCRTGELFFKIEVNGDVYRCFMPQALFSMGNITKGTFRRFTRPMPCTAHRCTCVVPANRNMILYGQKAEPWVTALAGLRGMPASLPHICSKAWSLLRKGLTGSTSRSP
ncbi:MAG: radical SAM protein [Gemmatimonadetes bacterium]|nr:radical SAM protein [Gemmatimonadota bacterium]MBT7858840.1 radical SAM protein [Gemmatimonadota bacterium]